MAWKYKISLTIIGLCLVFSILVLFSYKKYQTEQAQTSLVVVDSGLSINYMQGNKIKVDNKKKTYTFSITNNNEEMVRYYIILDNITTNKENIKYSLIEKEGKLNIKQNALKNEGDAYLASFIEIKANETHSYEFTIEEEEKANLNATLSVGIEDEKEEYFAAKIMKENEVKKEPITKVGEMPATTDEGLIETNDEQGVSYYYRGDVQNNYVNFANQTWRIVKINGDGSVKLILNDYIEEAASFYDSDIDLNIKEKLDFSKSKINTTLNNWYQENLNNYDKYLMSSKYCVDDSILKTEGETTYYLADSRLKIDYNQIYNCLGSTYTERVGLLTADETVFAGASSNSDNTNYYLHTKEKTTSWWTTTPNRSDNTNVVYFEITQNGKLEAISDGSTSLGLKPVITLQKKNYASGDGTINNPYMIKE